jgi:NUBPL iron-transfer P-loop NTPase
MIQRSAETASRSDGNWLGPATRPDWWTPTSPARTCRAETDWGDVEALVVDLPPGISLTQQGVLSGAGRVATILVVTPAEVSHLDTGRALSTLREVRTPVLGAVENMAYFQRPCCGEKTELHTPAPHERTIWASGVDRLARLPFRPDAVIDPADLAPSWRRWRRTSQRDPLPAQRPASI